MNTGLQRVRRMRSDRQKGLSITFGYLIVGVIGLVTLMVVVLGFDFGFSSSLNILSGWWESGSVDTECSKLADQIDEAYCTQYVAGADSCGDTHHEYDSSQGYTQTATEAGCEWFGSNVPSVVQQYLEEVDGEYRPIVSVEGDTYDCVEQGKIGSDPTCPAG